MKAVGCIAVVAIVAVGGFAALILWSLGNSEDQSALTEQVEATVVGEPRRVGQRPNRSWRLDVAYRTAGRWYGVESALGDDEWKPGRPVFVCVDPADPTQHVLTAGAECGQEQIRSGSIDEATPRPAP